LSLLKAQARKTADVSTTHHGEHGSALAPAHAHHKSGAGSRGQEALPYKQAFELVENAMPAVAQVVLVTTMPRGSLQIAQPAKLPEPFLKGYAREFHLEDRLTWQAILGGQPVDGASVLGSSSPFATEFLHSSGLAHAAAAPLKQPVIEGYPGALHVYRTAEQGPFSADEVRRLGRLAEEIDQLLEKAREARRGADEEPNIWLTHRPQARLFAFDERGHMLVNNDDFQKLDQRLRDMISEQARVRLSKLNGQAFLGERVQIADARGDLWTFRFVTYAKYPAIGTEPVVIVAMQPSCSEWALVRPADLAADNELARLIPALKFMRQEFSRGPTLGEISKQVHLSPFHFHRRFAELLGLTPKHYLLECQITQAKAELLSRKKELAQIATDCGFAHQSHFTSRFKQATGLTPTRWRRIAAERGA
jgi:AraC-like DNA-binding protein